MSGNRELATKELLSFLNFLAPKTENVAIYEKYLGEMTDKDFDAFMERLSTKKEYITLFVPINSEFKLTNEHLDKVAKKIGLQFWQRLYIEDPETGQVTLTQTKHLVIDLIIRRQVQMLWKKMSTAEDDKHIDLLTGQPTGASKGASSSYPENSSLVARGLDKTAMELIKMRGGDTDAYNVAKRLIRRDGGVELKDIAYLPTRAKVVDTASAFLKAMHLRNNL